MGKTTDRLYHEALKLDKKERELLAVLLIESLDDEPKEEVEAAWAAEIERRIAAADSGEVQSIPWEEGRARLLEGPNARKKG